MSCVGLDRIPHETGPCLCRALRLDTDQHDPWNETFMAGPTSFWRRVVRRLGAPAIHLRQRREALLRGHVPDAAVLIAPRMKAS